MPYAKNKDAVAVCNRSGQKMYRRDMVEDGYLRGLLVHPDWYDPAHPQEQPFDPEEGIAIYKPAPDLMPTPPAPVLSIAGFTGGVITLAWTQPDPPGSTVIRWDVFRQIVGTTGFVRIGSSTPVIPSTYFIQGADQIPGDVTTVGGMTFTDPGSAVNDQYYVVAITADTSIEHTDGLQSPPSNIVNFVQKVVQVFTPGASVWNKPAQAITHDLVWIGGGGGGGAGGLGFGNPSNGMGGSGGSWGFVNGVPTNLIPATVQVIVGAGGRGASIGSGSAAQNGGTTTFGILCTAPGGAGGLSNPESGSKNSTTANATSTLPGAFTEAGTAGGAGANQQGASQASVNGDSSTTAPTGGGGGNGPKGTSQFPVIGNGGAIGSPAVAGGLEGANVQSTVVNDPSPITATSGGNGNPSSIANHPGTGGGGGGNAFYSNNGTGVGTAGTGGNGVSGGGGGGGGGCEGTTNPTGGAGGNGGDGVMVITTWFF